MKEWSTLKKLIWLRKINGGGGGDPLNTFTGSIVRFLAKRSLPIVKLEANFTPIQDLNGQEAPYPPGGWKNKLPPTLGFTQGTATGVTLTENADGSYTFTGSASTTNIFDAAVNFPSGTYSFSAFNETANSYVQVYFMDASNNVPGSATLSSKNSTVTFTTENPIVKIRLRALASYSGTFTFRPLVAVGSTSETVFSPYSNICLISGWTGVQGAVTGFNVWDETWEIGNIDPSTGQNTNSNLRLRSAGYISAKPSTQYFFCVDVTQAISWLTLYFYDVNKNFIGTHSPNKNNAFTTPANTAFMRFMLPDSWGGATYTGGISVNYPSTDHDYHAYSGTTVSISFGTTVYGGTLTVNEDGSGQIDATIAAVDMGRLSYYSTSSGGLKFYTPTALPGARTDQIEPDLLCSYYPYRGGTGTGTSGLSDKSLYSNWNTKGAIIIVDSSYSTSDELKAALSGQKVAYPLAESITIPLTASQINTLVGENVVWVNNATGDITVQAYGSPIT